MADTKEFDAEQIKGGQSMDRQDRQYFERHGAAMSGQAEALAEQYDIDPKEMNDTFDTLMESLICNWKEYIVNGAPLKCSMQAEEGTEQTLFYQGNEITSKPVLTAGMSALQLPEERPEDARGFVFANISDTSGGLRDELVKEEGRLNITSFGNCKRIDEENITEIEEMLDGVCRALMNRYEYTGVTEEEMLSGILQALKQNMGTCFCCMVLNPEWENLPAEYDYVDNTFREEPMMSGIDRVLFADSYMRFNGREGINMMSMLFCRYGGGTISAKESGQRSSMYSDIGFGSSTISVIMGFEGNIGLRINSDGSLTIGYGYDFTKESDPDTFNKYFYIDGNGNIQIKKELEEDEAYNTVRLASEQKGIIQAVDSFINGEGYGNTKQPLNFSQNQYDALFSFIYSNGAYVFTDDAYKNWKDKGGESAARAEARKELADYLIGSNGNYDSSMIEKLFVNCKGGSLKYDYKNRREAEAKLFMSE